MVVDPRLIELCFQTAGILEIGTTGRMGLPRRVDRVMALRDAATAKGRRLVAIVRPSQGSNGHDGGAFDAYVADEAGNVYVSLEGYRTVEMPGGVDPNKRGPLQRAMG